MSGRVDPRTGTSLVDRRVGAWQNCYVTLSEAHASGLVLTHRVDKDDCMWQRALLRYRCTQNGAFLGDLPVADIACEDVPGGLAFVCPTPDGAVEVESFPLRVGQGEADTGAAVIRLRVPSGRAGLEVRGGRMVCLHHDLPGFSKDTEITEEDLAVFAAKGKTVAVTYKEWNISGVLCGNFEAAVTDTCVTLTAPAEELWLVFGFAPDAARAAALTEGVPAELLSAVKAQYDELLADWKLQTPDKNLDDAFTYARLSLEQSWMEPYGWIECIHHWGTMWHMEHTVPEEWAGNAVRSMQSLASQGDNLFPDGAVPCMCPSGRGRRDWGGDNQFFFRGLDHYVRFTGDLDFARRMEPMCDRVMAQTLAEYDPVDCGVLSWGTQIGNQEDMESSPGPAAGPGVEGVRMLEIYAGLKDLLGKPDEAADLRAAAARAKAALYRRLFRRDLGRYGWYNDALGQPHPETSYHAITYPVIYGQLCDEDVASSMDHLRHRLTGPDGEMYQSNHFADHNYLDIATWGMQCGSNMQAFATAAYAMCGRSEDAVRPLQFVADRVASPIQRGSFPETAHETVYGYFSPSAAVYAQAVIESLFGLRIDRCAGTMTVSPCLPAAWDSAKLTVPSASVAYTREGNAVSLSVKTDNDLRKTFIYRCPPCTDVYAAVDGTEVPVTVTPHCGFFELSVELGCVRDFELTVAFTPIEVTLDYTQAVACGDTLTLTVSGAALQYVDDRCGLFSAVAAEGQTVRATLRSDLLDAYAPYGRLGLTNFARRMCYAHVEYDGVAFTLPVPVTVMPAFVSDAALDENLLTVRLTSAGAFAYNGTASLRVGGVWCHAQVCVAPRSVNMLQFPIAASQMRTLVHGTNRAELLLGDVTLPVCFESAVGGEVRQIALNADKLRPAAYWNDIGRLPPSRSHMFLAHPHHYMNGLFDQPRKVDIPGTVTFDLNGGFIPFGGPEHRAVTLPLAGVRARKVYLLFSAFLTNHNIYSRILRVEVEAQKGAAYYRPVFAKDVCFPGDLDIGFCARAIFGFGTYVSGTRRDVPFTLPLGQDDYHDAQPPAFPQRYQWGDRKAVEVCDTVFNCVEIDLGCERELCELRLLADGVENTGGLFAVAVE